ATQGPVDDLRRDHEKRGGIPRDRGGAGHGGAATGGGSRIPFRGGACGVRAVGAGGAAGEDRDTGFRVSPYAQSFSPGARLILNCLVWIAQCPPLHVMY